MQKMNLGDLSVVTNRQFSPTVGTEHGDGFSGGTPLAHTLLSLDPHIGSASSLSSLKSLEHHSEGDDGANPMTGAAAAATGAVGMAGNDERRATFDGGTGAWGGGGACACTVSMLRFSYRDEA